MSFLSMIFLSFYPSSFSFPLCVSVLFRCLRFALTMRSLSFIPTYPFSPSSPLSVFYRTRLWEETEVGCDPPGVEQVNITISTPVDKDAFSFCCPGIQEEYLSDAVMWSEKMFLIKMCDVVTKRCFSRMSEKRWCTNTQHLTIVF